MLENIIENEIAYDIRTAIFMVYHNLGPGLLESVYERALSYELEKIGRRVKRQEGVPVIYEDIDLDLGFRLDLLVDDLVIVEIKSVDKLLGVHYKQVTTYLKLSRLRLGILVNFNTDDIEGNIKRIIK